LRILIADDHEVVRRGLRSLLSSQAEWQVCGEAVDGLDAIAKAKELRPDVVVLDISMPRLNGLEAANVIRREVPESEILILSQHDPSQMRQTALAAGARAYVAKSDVSRDLLAAVHALSKHRDPVVNASAALNLNRKLGQRHAENSPLKTTDTDWFIGGGEMGALMRARDWSQTSLGPARNWPQSLRTAVSICLDSRFPILVWWGPELVMLYNDGYKQILGAKHPAALGAPGRNCWPEIWDTIRPMLGGVLERGEATWSDDLLLLLERNGYPEECYFTFSYSPIRDESRGIGGVFTPVTETTERVIGERRLRTLRDLAARKSDAHSEEQTWSVAARTLAENPYDLPCAVLYKLLPGGTILEPAAIAGLPNGHSLRHSVNLESSESALAGVFSKIVRGSEAQVLDDLSSFEKLPEGVWQAAPTNAIAMPIKLPGQEAIAGILLAAVNPRKRLDDSYRGFFTLVAGQIGASLADARTLQLERERSQALAALNRAKTLFFSNVSHEFRTPLTLMLGPLEQLLRNSPNGFSKTEAEQLAMVQRNALRLLKLVNTLLDFSRLESGKTRASFRPTNLVGLTAGLASMFDSAFRQAGLKLVVDCAPFPEPVYVDRDMWEKIVLNLLSNALKFTLRGEVRISLKPVAGHVELSVADTGIGIAEGELPHIFERFHRVEGGRGRSYEGSGIGLAMVHELVGLHGGSIDVKSVFDRGTTFTISIPFGTAHLAPENIGPAEPELDPSSSAQPYVEESVRWLSAGAEATAPAASQGSAYILLADDNVDIQTYVSGLLSNLYEVQGVPNGEAALAAARSRRPDLILADIMMPVMDGFSLLEQLRSDPQLRSVPLILLSARAGEEARVEGLDRGADGYLVKPFSGRELLACVAGHLQRAVVHAQVSAARSQGMEQYQRLFHHNPQPMWIFDLETSRFLDVNEAAICQYGYSREEFMRMAVKDLSIDTDPETLKEEFKNVCSEPTPTGHLKHKRKDGSLIDVHVVGYTETFMGRPAYLAAITDVTERLRSEAALRESEERFRIMADTAPVMIWMAGPDADYNFFNKAWLDFTGRTAEQESGSGWAQGIHPADAERCVKTYQASFSRRQPFGMEYRLRRADGEYRWILDRAVPRYTTKGEFSGYIGSCLDITERKTVEQALRVAHSDMERRVRERTAELERKTAQVLAQAELLDLADEAILVRTLDDRVTYWNQGAERLYGWNRDEVLGELIPPIIQTEFPEPFANIRAQILKEKSWQGELVQSKRDGSRITVASRWSLWSDKKGNPIGFLELNTDITDRKRAEESVRALSGRLLQMQDEERRRIARELHDSAGQIVVALDIDLSVIESEVSRLSPSAARACAESRELVQEMSKELRTISHLLHPPLLDEAGLPSAVRWYVEGFAERSKIPVDLTLAPELGRLTPDLETTIFRIIQEALTNVHRHSESSTARIAILRDDGEVRVEIRDQGKGFSAGGRLRASAPPRTGVGIQGMRERVRQLGGSFDIQSGSAGTTISASFPVSALTNQAKTS
jgi:PAS domain S-box-containing protein